MMKPCALFLSNQIYFDPSKPEGGVKVCTEEYLALIRHLYEVEVFTVSYHISYWYRLRVKFGFNVYNDYQPARYAERLAEIIRKRNVKVVFLNLSNTAPFAKLIKSEFGHTVKIVLCSHGNESGDFLHEVTRFKRQVPLYRSWTSASTLGSLLKREASFRQSDLDGVLTVSPVEEALEYWLGAKRVLMIPRTVEASFLDRKPVAGRVGFIGDLSHAPNFYGVDEVCKAIASMPSNEGINIRLVGAPVNVGEQLAATYPFVTYLGYMSNDELMKEAASWAFFMNPVFYYSRGVITKLAKAFSWGLPVITSEIGCRGYVWGKGSPLIADSAAEMAAAIHQHSVTTDNFEIQEKQLRELVGSIPDMSENAKKLALFLDHLQ